MASSARTAADGMKRTALFVCDVQEKFRPAIYMFDEMAENIRRMVAVAKLLGIPIFVTEQYPRGLGPTLTSLDIQNSYVIKQSKTTFTMLTPEIQTTLRTQFPMVDRVLLVGVETHACVLATFLDLKNIGITVHVLEDCVSSRRLSDRITSLERIRAQQGIVSTSETEIFQLVGDAGHRKFREVQRVIREPGPQIGICRCADEPKPSKSSNSMTSKDHDSNRRTQAERELAKAKL